MSLQPLKPDTFTADLKAIREPDDDTVRKPLEWAVPVYEKLAEDGDEKSDECADRAYANMMSYIKMLQKHYSDFIMTTKIKAFSDEETLLWQTDRNDIMLKIVEHYSIVEFVRLFPHMTTKDEATGRTEFDLTAFNPYARQTKDGSIYIDEYQLQRDMKISQDNEIAAEMSHCDWDEKLGRRLTEDEVAERTLTKTDLGKEVCIEEEQEESKAEEEQEESKEEQELMQELN
jgi:hypothetical protein